VGFMGACRNLRATLETRSQPMRRVSVKLRPSRPILQGWDYPSGSATESGTLLMRSAALITERLETHEASRLQTFESLFWG